MCSSVRRSLKRLFYTRCGQRKFSSSTAQELKIPVPFGHLSAKAYGPSDGQPVLALHGWQDNAGTFDPLVPHLDPSLRIVALDLPGHGLSSHLPPGCDYHLLEYPLYMKAALDHLGWTKCSMLGHSMGGGLGLLFAGIFPQTVESVVALDILKPISVSQDELIVHRRTGIEKSVERFGKPRGAAPVYSTQEAADRVVRGSLGSLSTASANVILRRGSTPSQDGSGVVFTRDVRLRGFALHPDDVSCKTFLGGVRCNLLVVKATQGHSYDSDETLLLYRAIYARNCERFFYKELAGKHHLHMDSPEAVAALVNPFLLKRYCGL